MSQGTASATLCTAAKDDGALHFVESARQFAGRHKSHIIFRLLKYFTRCNERQLQFLICKIYCLSIPSSQQSRESISTSCLGFILLPLYLFLTRKWFWRRQGPVEFNFETTDDSYFRDRFASMYASLKGSKRITPRTAGAVDEKEVTDPIALNTRLALCAKLCIVVAAAVFPLLLFCLRNRINIMKAYRSAFSIFIVFDAYFKRYPCRNFVTYADDANHPARYIAFRGNCTGKLFVIQNGERICHPTWSFGMVDVYLTFGEAYGRMMTSLGYFAPDVFPVGSLALNSHFQRLSGEGLREQAYDILYIDNGSNIPPHYGGLAEDVARSEEFIFSHLNRLKSEFKNLRMAYQLRCYKESPDQKQDLLRLLAKYFMEDIEILDNDGKGESYVNVMRANLIITFQSTMGFEAMALGKKVLFVNYSGFPSETMSSDGRFQIEDTLHNYDLFRDKVSELLNTKLDHVPDIARERHAFFDGQVQERAAAVINQTGGMQ